MAQIIDFKQPAKWYIDQSEYWSKRGDSFKSLLYARQACEDGGVAARMRLAAALYETGNFSESARTYLRFIRQGQAAAEVYGGLIKCLYDMSRFRSAAYFLREANERGFFPNVNVDKINNRPDFKKAIAEVWKQFPDLPREYADEEDAEFKRLLYVIRHGDFNLDETLLPDLYLNEDDKTAAEILFKAAGIITPDKLNRQLAEKLLTACEEGLSDADFPRQDIIATKIITLITLGRVEEAEIAAEDLLSLEIPEDPIDLLKCAIAMLSIGYHEGAVDYLEELTNDVFEETLLYYNGVANMNMGDKDRAKELFSEVLIINPNNVCAKYWCNKLISESASGAYNMSLPPEAEFAAREKIDEMLTYVAESGGKITETDEMRDLLAYELRSDDLDFSDNVARSLAAFGIYRKVLHDYLSEPDGRLTIKHAILSEMLAQDYKTPLSIYLFGIKRVYVMRDLYGSRCSDGLIRAYVGALAAFEIFGKDDNRALEDVFDKIYPYLSEMDLSSVRQAENVASALVLFSGLESADTPKDTTVLFQSADEREIEKLCDDIEARYADVRRPKKNVRKRRK